MPTIKYLATRTTGYTEAVFHESTYGDYITFPAGVPRGRPTDLKGPFVLAGETLVVKNTQHNDGKYTVCLVEENRIVVPPTPGLASEHTYKALFRVEPEARATKQEASL